MCEGLGATYVKFGQFIASASGIVGAETAEEFRACLDAGPPVPFRDVRRAVEEEIGAGIESAFAAFEEAPFAAASIAVVHRARLHDGTPVAVKVLRPGIERTIATDLGMMEWWARFLASRGVDQAYNMVGLVVGLRLQVAEELDLRNEARTMHAFRSLFSRFGLSLLVVPHTYPQLSGRRVLTMDLLDGRPLDDHAHARAHAIDPAPLVRELMRAWILTGLHANAFHADIHAGNLLLLRDGRLGMLDWGIVARMDHQTARMMRSICEAVTGNEDAWDDIARALAEVNGPSFRALGLSDADIRRFGRALFEPVLTRPLSEVSMSDLLMNGDDVVRMATGEAPTRTTWGDRRRRMREAAGSYRAAADNGTFEAPAMRMGFLSMKQMVYLERYGRMYIPDESLFGDTHFIRRVLNESAAAAAAPAG
jgi:predicted unusual protein kinase regulating ubiquinone biosynthesis (AarF/ABC1/UbiB family)